MSLRSFHNKLISSRKTIPVSIILVFILRILSGIQYDDFKSWIVFLLQLLTAFSFMQMNHTYTIIQKRTILPSLLFLLFSSNPFFYEDLTGSIICLIIVFCLHFTFNSYQNQYAQINAFNIFFLITICSILWFPIVYLIPLIWFGFIKFQAFNFKTLNASIIGIFTVGLFILAWCLFKNNIRLFTEFTPDFSKLIDFQYTSISLSAWIYTGFIILLLIISRINSLIAKSSEKIRTGAFINFLNLLIVCFLFLFLFLPEYNERWLLIALIPVSFLVAHYFTLNTSKFSSFLLFFSIIFNIIFDVYYIIVN